MQVGDAAALHTQQRSSGVDLSGEEIQRIWSAVRSDEESTNWILLGYEAGSRSKLTVFAHGEGGFTDLSAHLVDDQVLFGVFRVEADGRTRFVFLYWTGESVGGMQKGRASLHKQGVINFFDGIVGEISATSREDLNPSLVSENISKLCGVSVVL